VYNYNCFVWCNNISSQNGISQIAHNKLRRKEIQLRGEEIRLRRKEMVNSVKQRNSNLDYIAPHFSGSCFARVSGDTSVRAVVASRQIS
jgi:hypothetical protein